MLEHDERQAGRGPRSGVPAIALTFEGFQIETVRTDETGPRWVQGSFPWRPCCGVMLSKR